MTEPLIILPEDRQWLERRIAELEQSIKYLGPEFHEVLNQSSETWHDNAPFDAVREKQDLLVAERMQLKSIFDQSLLKIPARQPNVVAVGSIITLQKATHTNRILIAGDWSPRSGKIVGEVLVVSRKSPIAQAVLGKSVGDQTDFGKITAINKD